MSPYPYSLCCWPASVSAAHAVSRLQNGLCSSLETSSYVARLSRSVVSARSIPDHLSLNHEDNVEILYADSSNHFKKFALNKQILNSACVERKLLEMDLGIYVLNFYNKMSDQWWTLLAALLCSRLFCVNAVASRRTWNTLSHLSLSCQVVIVARNASRTKQLLPFICSRLMQICACSAALQVASASFVSRFSLTQSLHSVKE